jgi:hypothetical protein
MTQSTLATVLAFARRGCAVLPINWPVAQGGRLRCSCGGDSRGRPCTSPAKHPYGAPNGQLSATLESRVIKHWFGYLAPQANLGVATDGLIVIDVDPRHGGDESFAALEREHELPPTWRVLTGGGRVIFACSDGIEIAGFAAEQMDNPPLGRGIDIHARGGYIVAPPSRHISGDSYSWSVDHHRSDMPLAPAPDWLITRLTARTMTTAADGAPAAPAEPIGSDVHGDLRWDDALQIVLDGTQLDHVRAEKQKAKKKSGDFTDADEGEEEDE